MKTDDSWKSDPELRELEQNLPSIAGNMDSPTTDSQGQVWRRVAFSGSRAALKKLLHHPVAQRLDTLAIVYLDGVLEELAGGHPLSELRELRLGRIPEGQDDLVGFKQRSCGDLSAPHAARPRRVSGRPLRPSPH
jgi:hypothetical protein